MLQSLSIRDFVLIEKLDLTFARGPTSGLGALTGETGAGKSILIDALGLALGARAESGVVRRGAAQASISASFDLARNHPAHAILVEQGLDDEDILTLRRAIGADGRGRAFVNDQPASVGLLRRLGDTLVEIQGQMDQHGLLDMATHRGSLDAFAGLEKQGAAVRAAWQAWRSAEQARADAEASAAAARRDEEFLRHAVKELEALAPRADDEETLSTERQLLRAGTALGEAVTQALGELEQGKGAVSALSTAHRVIERNVDKAVTSELAPLKLEKARFVTEVAALPEADWSEGGTDRVQFTVATNPGTPPAPIARIASGGELSRFLLALKVCLAKVGDAATIVFDEVDSGIGGATAAAVGERLKRLAQDVQVLVVTHSPQVAAIADRHWLIRKTTTKTAASTDVVALDAKGRREEIARMLSGAEVTAEARAAADRLLAVAG